MEAIRKIVSTCSHQTPIGLLPALLCFSWDLVKPKTRGQRSDTLLRGRQKGWTLGPAEKQIQVLLTSLICPLLHNILVQSGIHSTRSWDENLYQMLIILNLQ